MRRPPWLMFCAIVVALIVLGGAAFAAAGERRKIVVFQKGTHEEDREAVVHEHGGWARHRLALVDGLAVELPEQEVEALQRHAKVLALYDDLPMRINSVISFTPVPPPLVEMYPWGQQNIGVPAARQLLDGLGLWGVRVAILDTGLDLTHPELQPYIVDGYNALSEGNPLNYQDDNGHGTHMAGIMAAAMNGQGIIGAASHALLSAVKVLDNTGQGYLSDLLNGLEWVLAHDIQVVNMSLSTSQDSPLLEQAIQQLYAAGVIMVASAGNKCTGSGATDSGGDDSGGDDSGGDSSCAPNLDPLQGGVKYPARYPEVIAVGATDVNNQVTSYSRTGPQVDLVAPGGSSVSGKVLSTIHGSSYAYGSGTSQATAHVTGAIAVVLQLMPDLSVAQVLALLQTTATDLGYTPEQQGVGLVDVQGMVQTLLPTLP